MNLVSKSERVPGQELAARPEGELQEVAPLELALAHKFRSETDEATYVSTVISRIADTSVAEIDKLLEELHAVRDYLQAEGVRVEREAARYAQVSQTALASVRIITDSMASWKGKTPSAK
jgi:transaldolase